MPKQNYDSTMYKISKESRSRIRPQFMHMGHGFCTPNENLQRLMYNP